MAPLGGGGWKPKFKTLPLLTYILLIFTLQGALFASDSWVAKVAVVTSNGQTVKDNSTVPLNSSFILTYTIKPDTNMNSGETTTLSVPSTLKLPSGSSQLKESSGKVIANVTTSANSIKLSFTSSLSKYSVFTFSISANFKDTHKNGDIVTLNLPTGQNLKILIGSSSGSNNGNDGENAQGNYNFHVTTAGQLQDDPKTNSQIVAYQAQILNTVDKVNNLKVIKDLSFTFNLTGYSDYALKATTKNGVYLRIEGFSNNSRVVDENINSTELFTEYSSSKITVDGKKVIDRLLAKNAKADALRFTVYLVPQNPENMKDYTVKFSSTVNYNNGLNSSISGACEFRWIEKPPTYTGKYLQINVIYRVYNSKGELFSQGCNPTTVDIYDNGVYKTSQKFGDLQKNYGCSGISLYNEYDDGDAEQVFITEGFNFISKTVSYTNDIKTITFVNEKVLDEEDPEDIKPCPEIYYKLVVNVNWYIDGQKQDCNEYKDLSTITMYDSNSQTTGVQNTSCGFTKDIDKIMSAYQSSTPDTPIKITKTKWKQDIKVDEVRENFVDKITTTVTVDIDNYMGTADGDIIIETKWQTKDGDTITQDDCSNLYSVVDVTLPGIYIYNSGVVCKVAVDHILANNYKKFTVAQTQLPTGYKQIKEERSVRNDIVYITLTNQKEGEVEKEFEKILLNVDVKWLDENDKELDCNKYESEISEVFFKMFANIKTNCGFSRDVSSWSANSENLEKFTGLSEENLSSGFSFFNSEKTIEKDPDTKTMTINFFITNKKMSVPNDIAMNMIQIKFQTVDENGTITDDPCGIDNLETSAYIDTYYLKTGAMFDLNNRWESIYRAPNFKYYGKGGWLGINLLVYSLPTSHPRYNELYKNSPNCRNATSIFTSSASWKTPLGFKVTLFPEATEAGYTLASKEVFEADLAQRKPNGTREKGLFTIFTYQRHGVPENQEVDRIRVKWFTKSSDDAPLVEQECSDYETKLSATLIKEQDENGEPITEDIEYITGCEYDPGFKIKDATQDILSEDFVLNSKEVVVEDDGTKTLIFNNVKESGEKFLLVNIKWFEQKSPYRPAKELECSDFSSNVEVFDVAGDLKDKKDISCNDIFDNITLPDANQVENLMSKGFVQKSKSDLEDHDTYYEITFVNQKCLSGTDENGDCTIEEMPPYIGVPGVVNPTYPQGPNTIKPIKPVNPTIPGGGVYPGKPGKPTVDPSNPFNPIFVPPLTSTEVPTQISNKPFTPIFVDPNIKVNKVPEGEPGKDWGYELEYCDPYSTECYTLPIDDENDFKTWIGGTFYVYLIDAMINPNYIAQCQSQNSNKTGDLEVGTTLPFYFEGASTALNSEKKLVNHAPYKSYAITLSLGAGNGNNPYTKMSGVKIPDAHQKLSFMVDFIPNSENSSVKQHHICNTDHFALRPAYFATIATNSLNNIKVDSKNYLDNKPRITSSYTSNFDIQRRVFFPSDYKTNGVGYGVPNYQIELGFYKDNANSKKTTLIDVEASIIEASKSTEPYLTPADESCIFNPSDICTKGDCKSDQSKGSRSLQRSKALGRSAEVLNGNVIWSNKPMLIEAIFAYFNNGSYIGSSSAHSKIKNIRKGLAYFTGTTPTSRYNQDESGKPYEGRSLISTHVKNGEKVFVYNNIGDMQIDLIDNRWTIYDQALKDSVGRDRSAKCVLNSPTNSLNTNQLIGCNVGMESKTTFKFVPDFIEVTPIKVSDKLNKSNKTFTYFANKTNALKAQDDMAAKLELDATAYVSNEIYKVTNKFGKTNYPLIAYGYESGDSQMCGKDVDMNINYVFDCANPTLDIRVSSYLQKRCGNLAINLEKDCSTFPFDSRCHKLEASSKKSKFVSLKDAFTIFNPKSDKEPFKITLKDFKTGSATIKDVYFNFTRSKNYPTNPKIININDFDVKNIVEVGFNGASKDYIPAITGSTIAQTNKFANLNSEQAQDNNAHFYYGYVNSSARNYLLCQKGDSYNCDGKNRVDVDILVFSDNSICNNNSSVCNKNSSFLDIFNSSNYMMDRRMYRNVYDNYDSKDIKNFASKYISKIFKLEPSQRENSTNNGVEFINFEKFPANFSEDIEQVYTSDYFVYSDGRGFIPNATPYNVFRLVYHADQGNTWGGEGSVKLNAEDGKLDTVGLVPMGQNLIDTSKNLNRRIRYY